MLKTESVQLISVSTTAFQEEDLLLVTDLDEQEILDIIEPIVFAERSNDGVPYDNDDLFIALKNAYPSNLIQYYTEPNRMVI
jgi:hypothetical protein